VSDAARLGLDPHGEALAAGARRLRWAVQAAFFLNGVTFATFLARLPSTKTRLHLAESTLGLALTVLGIAGVATMQVAGRVIARSGSDQVTGWALTAMPVALLGTALATDTTTWLVALVVFGMVAGLLDLSMNAQGVVVERLTGQPVLSTCHASWSLGSMVGAGLASLALATATPPPAHVAVVGILVLGTWVAMRAYVRPAGSGQAVTGSVKPGSSVGAGSSVEAGNGRESRDSFWRAGWSRRVVALGGMGAAALLAETTVSNWGGVYLHAERGASLAVASLGFTALTTCQTLGRLVGDRAQQRVGRTHLVRVLAATAVAGLVIAVLSPGIAGVVAGFAVLGVGLSVLLPVLLSAVGSIGADDEGAALALSRFTTLTYSGSLLGPVAVGALAEAVGLRLTLTALIPLLGAVVVTAPLTGAGPRPSGRGGRLAQVVDLTLGPRDRRAARRDQSS